MAEIRLKDTVPHHPKFLRAGPAACWLHVCGLGYCQRMLTDGFIPAAVLHTLGVQQPVELVASLVAAKLWDEEEDGWRIHDYLRHNKSARQVRQIVKKRRLSGSLGGLAKGKRGAKQNAKQVATPLLGTVRSKNLPDRDRDRDRTVSGNSVQQAPSKDCKNPRSRIAHPVDEMCKTPEGSESNLLRWRRVRSRGVDGVGRPKADTIRALVRSLLKANPDIDEGELAELAKVGCARANLVYDSSAVYAAISGARRQLAHIERRLAAK